MIQAQENRPLLGVLLVVLAMSGIGFIDNFIRLIAADAGLWQFHFLRSIVICATVLVLAPLFKWRLRPNNWRAVALRSLFFSTAMVLYFGAAGMLPIAQVGAGLFTSPIFVLLISALFLGVRIGMWRIFAVALGFVGVLLILKPDASAITPLTVLPVLAGLLYALNGIATRQWCEGESTMTLLMGLFGALGLWGAAGLLVFTFVPLPADLLAELGFFGRGWVAPTWQFTFWMLVQAFGSLIAVGLLTKGYQLGEVSFIAVFEYVFLISAAFWAWVLWDEGLDVTSALGIAAISGAGVIIALRSR
jgi:drug/metabolite transporter (DMT)-like permease